MNDITFSKSLRIIAYFLTAISLFLILSCDAKLVTSEGNLPPFNLEITRIAEGQIKITWEYTATSNDTVTFSITKKSGYSDWYGYYNISDDNEFIDYIPTSDVVVYSYQISAYNYTTDVQSTPSDVVAYFSEYTYPTDIVLTQISQDQLEISWQDHSIGEEGFHIDRKVGAESWVTKYRTVGANTTSLVDFTTLYEEVQYRVYAFSGISTTESITGIIMPTLLAPSDLVLVKLDNQQIRLSWLDNSDGEEGFYIDKKIGELDWILDYAYVETPINTYIDDIELPCGDFYYRVRAVEGIYSSPYSSEEQMNILLDLIGSTSTGGDPVEVFISEETNWYTLISENYSGIAVIDCVDPSAPENQDYNAEGLPDRTLGMHVKDDKAYVTTVSGLEEHGRLYVIDLSSILPYHGIDFPDVLPIDAIVPISANPDDSYVPYDIYIEGDYAYIADGENGLEILDVSVATPFHVANLQTGGIARKVYVDGIYAYVSTGFNGVIVIDVTDPLNPVEVTNYSTTGFSLDAVERDGYIFVADGENGLKIINMSTDDVTFVPTGGFANSVYVQGQDRLQEDHVYLSDRENGLYVIDITDMANPYILGLYEMETEPVSIAKYFHSSYVYVADNEGLKIIQVAP